MICNQLRYCTCMGGSVNNAGDALITRLFFTASQRICALVHRRDCAAPGRFDVRNVLLKPLQRENARHCHTMQGACLCADLRKKRAKLHFSDNPAGCAARL